MTRGDSGIGGSLIVCSLFDLGRTPPSTPYWGKIIYSVRLDVAERDALEKAAKADDRTAAAVVRRLIRDFLREGGLLK